jgi:TonB-linked SusC/RagA family outer membrane protein
LLKPLIMTIKRLLRQIRLLLLCVIFTQIAFSQTKTISGKISDDKGGPLQGATISVKGSRAGTSTDAFGAFKINVPANAKTLVISSVGFGSKEIDIASQTSFEIALVAQGQSLGDVVVTGYGTARKKDLTGAIENISSKDFNQGVVSNPMQQIQGKVAGLVITQPGGDPNQSVIIRLRGQTSLTGGQTPLIVVDGVPLDDANQIQNIPPGDIESYDVLKDASATAIYGSRGANGVIIINTKKGHAGKTQVDYNGYVGVDRQAKKYDLLNLAEWQSASHNYLLTQTNSATHQLYTPAGADTVVAAYNSGGNTNWQDAISRTGVTHSHTVSISGGSNTGFNYRGSVSYLNQEGIIINSGKEEVGLRFNAQQKALDNKLDIQLGVVHTQTNRKLTDYGVFNFVFSTPPSYPVYNPDGSYHEFSDFEQANPVEHFNLEVQTGKEYLTILYSTVNYEFLKGLKLGTTGSLSHFNDQVSYYIPTFPIEGSFSQGHLQNYNTDSKKGDIHLNYQKQFGEHNLALTGVYEYNDYSDDNFYAGANQFLVPQEQNFALQNGNPSNNSVSSFKENYLLISFLARAVYNYAGKYYFTGSFRRDGSSKFGIDNRWGNFPSASLGWRISQENFLKNVSWLTDLKIRGGIGVTGNSDAITPYSTQLLLGPSNRYFNPSNSAYPYPQAYSPSQNSNPNLKWEERVGKNIGADFSLLNGRFGGTINYFSDKTNNLLYNYLLPSPPYLVINGGSSTALLNVGSLTNKGVEISLNAQIVKGPHFNWSANGQITFVKTRVTKLSGVFQGYKVATDNIPGGQAEGRGLSTSPITFLKLGYAPYVFYLPHFAGTDGQGHQLFDSAGSKVALGHATFRYTDPSPKFNYGISNTFSYDNWSLNFFLRGVFGQKVFNNTALDVAAIDRLPGNNVFKSALTNGIYAEQPAASDLWLEKASFLRLDNLTIAYNFKKIKGLQNLRVYASGNNLFVITPYKGLDPEIRTSGDAVNNSGVTNEAYIDATYGADGYYPRARSFSFGVNLSFQ